MKYKGTPKKKKSIVQRIPIQEREEKTVIAVGRQILNRKIYSAKRKEKTTDCKR